MSRSTEYQVEPQHIHTHTVIFLHGRDSAGREFADELFESEASEPVGQPRTLPDLFPSIKWVFPTAQPLHSARFDAVLSQWFDIWSVEDPAERPELQQPGLRQSIGRILEIIKQEERLVPRSNIFLCGISQGFATIVAAYFAETRGGFAGLVGLCGWIPYAPLARACLNTGALMRLHTLFAGAQTSEFDEEPVLKTPVFLGHSRDDGVVPIKNGRELRDMLQLYGLQVEWREYEEGGHWINEPQGVDHIARFLSRNMQLP